MQPAYSARQRLWRLLMLQHSSGRSRLQPASCILSAVDTTRDILCGSTAGLPASIDCKAMISTPLVHQFDGFMPIPWQFGLATRSQALEGEEACGIWLSSTAGLHEWSRLFCYCIPKAHGCYRFLLPDV
jgi:hypothetical protein